MTASLMSCSGVQKLHRQSVAAWGGLSCLNALGTANLHTRMKQQAGGKLMHLVTLQMIIFVIGRYNVVCTSIRRCFKDLHKQAHSL